MALPSPDIQSLKKINWRKVASYANPQSVKDFDAFLDRLPQRAGMNGIIIASIIWGIAGAAILFAYTKSVDIQKLHEEMTQAEALRPTVPVISHIKVPDAQIKAQVEKMQAIYKGLSIDMSGSTVKISAASARDFAAWRAAIGDLAYGGIGWRVQVSELCAGRECSGTAGRSGAALQAVLSVQQLDINLQGVKS